MRASRKIMSKRNITAASLLAIAILAALSLVYGASYLELPLPGGLPIGNLLAALGLCAIPGAALALSPRGTALRKASGTLLICASLWLPLSVVLAGNLQLNFGDGRGASWLALSAVVGGGSFFVLLWALGIEVISRIRGAGAA